MKIIDTHAHLNDPKFQFDYEEVFARCMEADMKYIINVGSNVVNSEFAVKLAEKHDALWAAVGIHPQEADSVDTESLKAIESLLNHPKVVGIGETGFDYYYETATRENQWNAFVSHVELALKYDLPVIIHDRDAHGDTLKLIQEYKGRGLKGVFHCYSGSAEMAKQVVNLGFYVSFAGPVTYKNAPNLKEAAKSVPLDRILVETDCPYLAPQPVRGKRNEPHYVIHTAEEIASLREMDLEEFVEAANENAYRLFQFERKK